MDEFKRKYIKKVQDAKMCTCGSFLLPLACILIRVFLAVILYAACIPSDRKCMIAKVIVCLKFRVLSCRYKFAHCLESFLL